MESATTGLFTAIRQGDLAAVESLLREHPGLAAGRDASGVSAVMWACYVRQGPALAALLARQPTLDIFEAVAVGDEARASALLAADPGLALAWSADGFSALHLAAFFRRPSLAVLLIASGADPSAPSRNPMGVAPLHSAAAAGSVEACRLLLERGTPVDALQPEGYTALMSAAQQGNAELAELLLAHGASPGLAAGNGRTAVALAEEHGHHDLAARLRERATINRP